MGNGSFRRASVRFSGAPHALDLKKQLDDVAEKQRLGRAARGSHPRADRAKRIVLADETPMPVQDARKKPYIWTFGFDLRGLQVALSADDWSEEHWMSRGKGERLRRNMSEGLLTQILMDAVSTDFGPGSSPHGI